MMNLDDMLQDAAEGMPHSDEGEAESRSSPSSPEAAAEVSDQPTESADTSQSPPAALCENCQTPLLGVFCHRCGQSDRSLDLSFGAFARDWLGSVFGFDGRVWRTLSLLLIRPGRLSHEYLQGRRASYVSPLRLYFFVSLAAFLVLTAADGSLVNVSKGDQDAVDLTLDLETLDLEDPLAETPEPQSEPDGASQEESPLAPPASSEEGPEDPESLNEAADMQSSETVADSVETTADAFEAATEDFVERAVETATGNRDQFKKEFAKNLPKAVFVLVPFYAVLLKLFFRRRYRSFVQHLVVSLHLHTTAFVLIALGNVADLVLQLGGSNSDPGSSLATLILVIHTFMSLRQAYGDRRRVLMLKYAFLSMAHLIALGLVMFVNLFFAFYQMGVFE